MSRDPIGDEGFTIPSEYSLEAAPGLNLYGFVSNNSISLFDFLGLAASECDDPCGAAKQKGLDKGSLAGVVCCNGIKYPCVWRSGGSSGAKNSTAKGIIDKCTSLHEKHHCPFIDCGANKNQVTRPNPRQGIDTDKEEVAAYTVEIACLKKSVAGCKGDKDCISQVKDEIQHDKDMIDYYSGK